MSSVPPDHARRRLRDIQRVAFEPVDEDQVSLQADPEGSIGFILGLYGLGFRVYRGNGKENGNYYNGFYRDYMGIIGFILGLYRGNGKENGSYYNGELNGKEHGKLNGN